MSKGFADPTFPEKCIHGSRSKISNFRIFYMHFKSAQVDNNTDVLVTETTKRQFNRRTVAIFVGEDVLKKIDSSLQLLSQVRFPFFFLYTELQKIDRIDKYRCLSFANNSRDSKRAQISFLPPAFVFAYQHLYRIYWI